jgi:hypothetical protein
MKHLWALCLVLAVLLGFLGSQSEGWENAGLDACLVLLVIGMALYLGAGAPAAERW